MKEMEQERKSGDQAGRGEPEARTNADLFLSKKREILLLVLALMNNVNCVRVGVRGGEGIMEREVGEEKG